MNGESDKMVPTKNTVDLDRRLPNSQLVLYPDAGHGGVFQFHEGFAERTSTIVEVRAEMAKGRSSGIAAQGSIPESHDEFALRPVDAGGGMEEPQRFG